VLCSCLLVLLCDLVGVVKGVREPDRAKAICRYGYLEMYLMFMHAHKDTVLDGVKVSMCYTTCRVDWPYWVAHEKGHHYCYCALELQLQDLLQQVNPCISLVAPTALCVAHAVPPHVARRL
jgi:hypothetical protein